MAVSFNLVSLKGRPVLHYKLLGFSHKGSVRHFRFERVGIGMAGVPFTVLADVSLLRSLNLSLQQLPSLCVRFLEAAGDNHPGGTLVLTEEHLQIYAAENAAAATAEAAHREMRSRRCASAMAARMKGTSAAVDR